MRLRNLRHYRCSRPRVLFCHHRSRVFAADYQYWVPICLLLDLFLDYTSVILQGVKYLMHSTEQLGLW